MMLSLPREVEWRKNPKLEKQTNMKTPPKKSSALWVKDSALTPGRGPLAPGQLGREDGAGLHAYSTGSPESCILSMKTSENTRN